jgi:hypothetical protein
MRKNNHFKSISIAAVFMVLFPCALCFAQQNAVKTVVLDSHRWQRNGNIAANAHYNVIVAKRFIDQQDTTRQLDPSGESLLKSLTVEESIVFDDTDFGFMGITRIGAGGGATIDFNGISGDAEFNNLTATAFYMHDPGPQSWRDGGKLVWDIAEGIEVEDAADCDVVVISKNKDLAVTRSTTKFDTSVAGVISESPKLLMGTEPGHKPLALAGVVRCKVNTENGPVKRGDILVSSSEPGYAMRAGSDEVLPGMVVGSALDSLEEGKGKIFILVNQ